MTEKSDCKLIAVPVSNGKLCGHFGHCQQFALIEVDRDQQQIIRREDLAAPPHAPGLLPTWLAERGVQCVIAGGIGQKAQQLFSEHGITVMTGATVATPEELVVDYLAGKLMLGDNACDH